MQDSLVRRGWDSARVGALLLVAVLSGCPPPSDPEGPWRAPQPEPVRLACDGTVLGVDGIPPDQMAVQNVSLVVRVTAVTEGGAPLSPVQAVGAAFPGGPRIASVGAEVAVQLAPGWYLDEKGLRFEKNTEVHVEGQYRNEGGKVVLYATRVTQGTQVVELRDEKGNPLWPAPSGAPPSSTQPIKPTPKD